METNIIYIIILGITVISYLLGLFLSFFEKKGKVSVLSQMGNVGFVNIYGVNMPTPEELYQKELETNHTAVEEKTSEIVDDEII